MKAVILLLQQQWCVLLLFLLPAAAASPPPPPPPISMPGCPDKCGNESVPYPFGFGRRECFKNSLFKLDCSYDDKDQKYKLLNGAFEIVNVSIDAGTATTYIPMTYNCYNNPGNSPYSFWLGERKPFTFSSKQNKFTALGCNTKAMMLDRDRESFMTGCLSACYYRVNFTDEDSGGRCSGIGCCRTQIPKGFRSLNVTLETNFTQVTNFSSCSYASLADQEWYGYTSIDLTDTLNVTHTSPVVVDWVVGSETCESFSKNNPNPSSYACGVNTNCNNSDYIGYLCFCKKGYQGNPYLGCQDIDECKDPKTHNCAGTCKNTVGSFTCHCPLGTYVDDKGACKGFRLTTLAGVVGACLSLVVMIFFLWMECKRSNKARNFRKNGGTLLKHQSIKIFKEEELRKATGNYHRSQFLDRGGSGSLYKGVLDKQLVAIKKPNLDDDKARRGISQWFRSIEEKNHEFLNEIKMICSVNHKNVVKLKGLCLETNVPLLVYEFVCNGSLFKHLHVECLPKLKWWKDRLRIACETAVAVQYLHSMAGTTPIMHGDVKSKNILLDDNFTSKVADFGASVLIPLQQNNSSTTKIRGTRGYIDPEYLSTGKLTVKSDVYSFGVVLMELLTSQKPISKERSIEKVDYIPYFVLSVEKENLGQVIDYGGLEDTDEEMKLQVEVVAKLAVKCLNRSSLGRPDMTEVVQELEKLNARNSGVRVDDQSANNIINAENEILLIDQYNHSVDSDDEKPMLSSSSTETQ